MDISKLSIDELVNLNRQVVARINHLSAAKQLQALGQFKEGDSVTWNGRNGRQFGYITKLNRKSATVQVGLNEFWRVSPSLLSPFNAEVD